MLSFQKVGCFVIYSIFLIIVGMGLYKYRAEVISYLTEKYNELVEYVNSHTSKVELPEAKKK